MNLSHKVVELAHRVEELENTIRLLLDQRVQPNRTGALDIATAVVDSNGRVGTLADLFKVNNNNKLVITDPADSPSVTGGVFAYEVLAVSGVTYNLGQIYQYGVGSAILNDVELLHPFPSQVLQVGDRVIVCFLPEFAGSSTYVPKIVNYFYMPVSWP